MQLCIRNVCIHICRLAVVKLMISELGHEASEVSIWDAIDTDMMKKLR